MSRVCSSISFVEFIKLKIVKLIKVNCTKIVVVPKWNGLHEYILDFLMYLGWTFQDGINFRTSSIPTSKIHN